MHACVCVGGREGGRRSRREEKWVLCVWREEVRSEEGEMNVWERGCEVSVWGEMEIFDGIKAK